ncbi:hypothetical protein OJ393_004770, partial [Salmonella enterica]|nr:hypothetical protein [Salmonella enterica]
KERLNANDVFYLVDNPGIFRFSKASLIKRDVTTEVSLADGDIILLGGLAEQSDGLFWPLTCRRLHIVQAGITTVLPEEAIKYGK